MTDKGRGSGLRNMLIGMFLQSSTILRVGRFATLAALLVGAALGYWLHERYDNSGWLSRTKSVPEVDYFTPRESFSRIDNAKSGLEGLYRRFRLEIGERLCRERLLRLKPGNSCSRADTALEGIICDLEGAMKEFEGTDQELEVAEDLLYAMKRRQLFGPWVEVYLKALYKHPTHPMIGRFAKEAIEIGRFVGKEEDVIHGLSHLRAIPLEFQAKHKAEIALNQAKARSHFVHGRLGADLAEPP